MGLGCTLIWNLMLDTLQFEALFLLLLGGFFYIIGIVFFILGEYKPIYHVIWHLFVVCGAVVHWFDVYLFIIRTDITSSTKDAVLAAANVAASMVNTATNVATSSLS